MEDQISLVDVWKTLAGYDPAVWAAAVAAIVTFIIEAILYKKGIIFSRKEKKLEMAKALGHTLTATKVCSRFNDRNEPGEPRDRMYIATYEYQVNGKTKRKRETSTSVELPSQITLYYTSSPNRVFSEFDVGSKPMMLVLYIIPILVAYAVMTLLGFEP